MEVQDCFMLSYSHSRQLSAKLVGLKRVYLGFFFIAIRDLYGHSEATATILRRLWKGS